MSNYVSLTELKNTAELIGFSFADYDATQAINAAEQGIEEYCGRTFYPSAATVTRYYAPTELGYVLVDDLITAGTVASDADGDGTFETLWTANTDYILWPYNATADGKPFERLDVNPSSSLRFPARPRSVLVTGQFGWLATPPQVKEATTIMATRLLRRAREAPFGVVGLGIDNAPVRISRVDPDVAWLLDSLIRGQGILAA